MSALRIDSLNLSQLHLGSIVSGCEQGAKQYNNKTGAVDIPLPNGTASTPDLSPTTESSWTGAPLTRPPPVLAPSPRLMALGLCISPIPAVPSSLRRPSTPSTPGIAAPGTPDTPRTPGTPLMGTPDLGLGASPHLPSRPASTRALSLSLARRASAVSLQSEDGIDVSKLDLRPVYTPPPGTVPLPSLSGPMHPMPSPGLGGHSPVAAILPINHHHIRRSSTGHSQPTGCYSHTHSHSPSVSASAAGSVQGSPLLGPSLSPALPIIPPGPTLAETGLRLQPDCSHASGQLARKSPRPGLIRLDSFGGEGLELKPSSRQGTLDEIDMDSINEGA